MSEEGEQLPGVDWRQVLPSTHLFRAFRISIHPSKLLLALALLTTVYVGGRLLDSVWPRKYQAAFDEVTVYQADHDQAEFDLYRTDAGDRFGIFRTLFDYQSHEFDGIIESVKYNQWFKTPDAPGAVGHVYNFLIIGPLWLVQIHTVFAVFFAILFLAAWSLFGGALARLAAVHVARDEKIPLRQALNFAAGKFLSFFTAPLIPILIVLLVGLLLFLGALVCSLPIIGPIVLGGAFALALLAGFVQTLVVLGAIGGMNLMYPTVAVEGSDSFDAISRSFSYIYARPWGMLFYTAVSVVYGAVTYLFVRFFILLMLMFAHHFVAAGLMSHDTNGLPLLPTMWPSPLATGRLTYEPNYAAMSWSQSIGAALVSFWIYLIIGILGSFVISFYFSANTIIYLLLRRDLDATELDDVYLEDAEEDAGQTAGEEVPPDETAAPSPPESPTI
jgi:hypothetical protein